MAEGEETKGSTATTASGATGETVGSKSQRRDDDDPDRLGGDIMTRSAGQPSGGTGLQEEGEQPAGRAGSADDDNDDDPVRGG
jgi:hypothetical protein